MQNKEMVVHPNHYQLNINIEVMDVIEIVTRKFEGIIAFQFGNVIKYLLRAEKKNGIEDYKKAHYYLSLVCDFTLNYTDYKKTDKVILKKVIENIGDETIKKCFEALTRRKSSEAYKILTKYINSKIKEKEND